MGFFNKLFGNKSKTDNPDNTKLFELLDSNWKENGKGDTYKNVVLELMNGDSFLMFPTHPRAMIKLIRGVLCILLCSLFLFSCHIASLKRTIQKSTNDEPVENIYDFKPINSPFKMRVIDFVGSGVGCGVIITCSSCLGINENNDTIKVLTQCPEFYGGYSFKTGQNIMVLPDVTTNKLTCNILYPIIYDKKNKKTEFSIQQRKYITTYGTITLIN